MFNRGRANELAKNEDKQNFLTKYKEAEEFIHPLLEEMDRLVQKESAGNKTFASWVSLINNELVPFIALAVVGRTGNWELRNAALKAMKPVTGRTNYYEELQRHLNHFVTIYSDYILKYLENGGFAVNLSFNPASSVFSDECHEMTINTALQVPERLSKENIEAISNYLPYRADMRKSWSVTEAPKRKEYVNTKHFTQSHLNQQENVIQKMMSNMGCNSASPGGIIFYVSVPQKKLIQPFTATEATKHVEKRMLDGLTLGRTYMESHVTKYLRRSTI